MADRDVRTPIVGFLAALAILGVILWVVGVGEVVAAIARADNRLLVGLVPVALLWLGSWGMALRTVLGALGIAVSPPKAVLIFAAATFSNNVTPFGQAGGEPLTALLISRATDSEYETSLAAIASVDALNFVPSILFALLSLGYYAATITLNERLETAAIVVGAMAVVLPIAAALAWRNRYRLEGAALRVVTPIVRGVARLIPRRDPPTRTQLTGRVEGFFRAIERVGTDPRRVLTALALSACGWLSLVACLTLALVATGGPDPTLVAAAAIAVPVGAIASITPLPGGLGGIEAVLIALLVPTTGLPVPVVSAAVLLYRIATYWLSLLVGGGAATAFGARTVL